MVLPAFVKAALQGDPLTVYGDGNQSRVFCHVSDAVDGALRVFHEKAGESQAFNIGGEGEITIKALAELVIAETKSSSQIEMIPYEKAYIAGFEDTMRRIPDTTKLRKLTGWAPKYSLPQIIADVASHIKAH
jgi:UDP-glucose 4-epimerase